MAFHALQKQDLHQQPVYCWGSVADGGPAIKKQWINVWCLLLLGFDQDLFHRPKLAERMRSSTGKTATNPPD